MGADVARDDRVLSVGQGRQDDVTRVTAFGPQQLFGEEQLRWQLQFEWQ